LGALDVDKTRQRYSCNPVIPAKAGIYGVDGRSMDAGSSPA
jgi:hypothetical protein